MLKCQLKSIRAELDEHEPSSPTSVELIKIRYSRVPDRTRWYSDYPSSDHFSMYGYLSGPKPGYL